MHGSLRYREGPVGYGGLEIRIACRRWGVDHGFGRGLGVGNWVLWGGGGGGALGLSRGCGMGGVGGVHLLLSSSRRGRRWQILGLLRYGRGPPMGSVEVELRMTCREEEGVGMMVGLAGAWE